MQFVTDTPLTIDTDDPPSPLMLVYLKIVRRIEENDPVTTITVPGCPFTLRVLGYTRDGTPVIHSQDSARLAKWKAGRPPR